MALFGLMVSEPLGIVVGWEQRWGAAPSGALELLRLHACKQRAQAGTGERIQLASSEPSAVKRHLLESPQLSKCHCKRDPSTLNLWGPITVTRFCQLFL